MAQITAIPRAFLKGWVLGKLTSCEDDFASLVWPSRGEFFLIKKFSSNNIARQGKPGYFYSTLDGMLVHNRVTPSIKYTCWQTFLHLQL